MVHVEGSRYSVPSHWKSLEVTAWVGVDDLRIVCRQETILVPRVRRGGRHVQYRHYLGELAKKPQAVRQVAPELVAELGEPYGRLWKLLAERHGPREGARVLAKIVGVVAESGPGVVADALEPALAAGRCDLLALQPPRQAPVAVTVPEPLRGYEIDAARAADFDALLTGEPS